MLQSIMMTGEGVTDMGACNNEQPTCSEERLDVGPMASLLFKLVMHHLPDWNVDNLNQANPEDHMTLISGSWLKAEGKKRKRGLIRSSKSVQKGMIVHAQRAQMLAEFADQNGHEVAAYFHDTDGSRSQLEDTPDRQEKITQSIKAGFRAAKFEDRGLAIVPKPTSEAWLICAAKDHQYQDCSRLETSLSGNEHSPNRSPKVMLGTILEKPDYTRDDLNELVEQIDVSQLDMPSFDSLREQVKVSINAICGEVNNN